MACGAILADAGINLIDDDVIFDARVLAETARMLHAYDVLFLGGCARKVAIRREKGLAPAPTQGDV